MSVLIEPKRMADMKFLFMEWTIRPSSAIWPTRTVTTSRYTTVLNVH